MNPIHSMNPSMTPVVDQTLKCTQDMARRNKKVAAWMIERQKAPRAASARQAGMGTGLRRHAWIHRIDHGQISTRDLEKGVSTQNEGVMGPFLEGHGDSRWPPSFRSFSRGRAPRKPPAEALSCPRQFQRAGLARNLPTSAFSTAQFKAAKGTRQRGRLGEGEARGTVSGGLVLFFVGLPSFVDSKGKQRGTVVFGGGTPASFWRVLKRSQTKRESPGHFETHWGFVPKSRFQLQLSFKARMPSPKEVLPPEKDS